MADFKDYGDYFARIERNILNENHTGKKAPGAQNSETYDSLNFNLRTKAKKKKIRLIRKRAILLLLCLALAVSTVAIIGSAGDPKVKGDLGVTTSQKGVEKKNPFAKITDKTVALSDEIKSSSVVFIDVKSDTVVASKNAEVRCYPASTTKIMTLLVAAERLTNLNDTFTITYEITDPLYEQEATVAGFLSGETVTMYDLLYGTILPSGCDAAIALAIKIAGSEHAFAELMNKKAKQLGLKNTNFVNCTGLYNKNHYTSALDLSVILNAAMKDSLCRKILTAQTYVSTITPQHPNGISMNSTLFKYMYGTEAENAVIEGGKTGYTDESGYCIASFGTSKSERSYLCVALNAPSRWPAVYDQINLYKAYAK